MISYDEFKKIVRVSSSYNNMFSDNKEYCGFYNIRVVFKDSVVTEYMDNMEKSESDVEKEVATEIELAERKLYSKLCLMFGS